jgi:hypothetical protein
MIPKYLILMSMTCVETAGNDPTSLAEAPLIQILLTMTNALTTVFSGYSDIFVSQRSLPSLLLTIEEVQVFECAVSIHTLVLFMSRMSSTHGNINVTSPLFFPRRATHAFIGHSSQLV